MAITGIRPASPFSSSLTGLADRDEKPDQQSFGVRPGRPRCRAHRGVSRHRAMPGISTWRGQACPSVSNRWHCSPDRPSVIA